MALKCEGTEDCNYQLKIGSNANGPEEILIGSPIKDVVEGYFYNYYYFTITESMS